MPDGFSFVRNSIATRYNAQGLIETVNANVPRISYSPTSLTCTGLLLEESRTNLLTNSAEFTEWNTNSVNMTTQSGTAPDGSNTAVKLMENTGYDNHYIYRSVSFSSSNTYSFSFFAKAGNRSIVSAQMEFAGDGYAGVNVDLTDGSEVKYIQGATADQIQVNPVGNGWWRFSYTSSNNNRGGDRLIISVRNTAQQSDPYQGENGYVYIWGVQFEQGAYFTSYIPTTSSTVTRGAETYSLPTAGWYNTAEGAFLCRFNTDVPSVDLRPLLIWDGTNNNRLVVQRNTSNQLGGFGVSGGTVITLGTLGSQTTGNMNVAFAYRSTDYRLAANNTLLAVPSNTASPPAVTTMTNQAGGRLWLQKINYYPHRLPSPYLQTLTQ